MKTEVQMRIAGTLKGTSNLHTVVLITFDDMPLELKAMLRAQLSTAMAEKSSCRFDSNDSTWIINTEDYSVLQMTFREVKGEE